MGEVPAGVVPERVVEVRASLPAAGDRPAGMSVGSGTLLGGSLVLTAAHVVFADDGAPLDGVKVRTLPELGADAPATPGQVIWPAHYREGTGRADVDAALIRLQPANDSEPGRQLGPGHQIGPVRWGWLTGRSPVEVAAVGFPRVLRDPDGTRDSDQMTGRVAPGARAVARRYDITVTSAAPSVPPRPGAPSPWSGMSGAGLFARGRLIGVVIIDTPDYPATRLSALPMHRLLEQPAFTQHLAAAGQPVGAVLLESVEVGDLLVSPAARPPQARRSRLGGGVGSPASLLRADAAVVPFHRRENQLTTLQHWCSDPGLDLAVTLLVGPGGQGKTRLARRLATLILDHANHAARDTDTTDGTRWLAGLLPPDQPEPAAPVDLAPLADSRTPLLLVIDYAETRVNQLRRLLRLLLQATDPPPSRLLLLARAAGDWWTQLHRDLDDDLAGGDLGPVLELPALTDPPDRNGEFTTATHAFAAHLPLIDPAPDWTQVAEVVQPPADLADPRYGNPLTLHLAALTQLLDTPPPGSLSSGEGAPSTRTAAARGARKPLEAVLLDHEQRYWNDTAQARRLGLQPETLHDIVAVAALCGATTTEDALVVLRGVPWLADQTNDILRGVDTWLAGLYPAEQDRRWGSLQPDRVAEYLAATTLRQQPDLLGKLLNMATAAQTFQLLTVLARALANPSITDTDREQLATQLHPALATDIERLGPVALQVASQTADPAPLLAAIDRATTALSSDQLWILTAQLPHESVALADLAVTWTSRLVEHLHHPPHEADVDKPDLADWLNDLSVRLNAVGRLEDALTSIDEAVDLYRDLVAARPDAYRPDLARALTNQTLRLAAVGRLEDALTAANEAVRIRRELVATRPDANRANLAGALNNQTLQLAALGRFEDALTAANEAVDLYRDLGAAGPDAHRPDLARALTNQSNQLGAVGRLEDALTSIDEAVELYRDLVAARPDAYRPNLARALTNQTLQLAAVGRREDALTAANEAVDLYRDLVAARPDAHRPDLARALNNQTLQLAAVGRLEDALSAITEAVELYRDLVAVRPDAHRPDLAHALTNQSNQLGEAGRREDALTAIDEAVELYRDLVAARPDAHRPNLATALNNQSNRLAAVGRREDALTVSSEAVDLYRDLVAARPDAHRPNLATALNNQSNRLAAVGRREDALTVSSEAVDLYRDLVAARPDAHRPELAAALVGIGLRLTDLERHRDALGADQEAVTLYLDLYALHPEQYQQATEQALQNVAIDLRHLEWSDEAIESEINTLLGEFGK